MADISDIVKEALGGVKPAFLAMAFAGAVAAESFWPSASIIRTVTNVVVGTAVSAASTPALLAVAAWKWPGLPDLTPVMGGLYFWVGLFGMQIVPLVSAYLNKLKPSNGMEP